MNTNVQSKVWKCFCYVPLLFRSAFTLKMESAYFSETSVPTTVKSQISCFLLFDIGRICLRNVWRQCRNKFWSIECPTRYRTGWLADRCSLSQQLGALQTHTTDTFLFISHKTNLLLFKFRCNIFIGVGIIEEMPGSVASRTLYTYLHKILKWQARQHNVRIYTCLVLSTYVWHNMVNKRSVFRGLTIDRATCSRIIEISLNGPRTNV